MDVLTISLGRNILKSGSREQERMREYVKYLEAFHIVVLTRTSHGYSEEIHEGNLHVYPTNSRSRFMMLVDAYFLSRKIAMQTRATSLVVSAQDPLEIGWLCLLISRIKNTKLHVQVHGDYFSSEGWVGNSLARRLRRHAALIFLRHAPCIRVVSNRIKKSLTERGVTAERITVLPIRPELESFLSVSHSFREVPPFTFLYVGRLAPEKDISRILHSFVKLCVVQPLIHLRIVGDGEEKEKIKALIVSLGVSDKVTLVSWTEDVPHEMLNADVFLLASFHEAYALTLVEAMAVGLPLITTDVGCVGEVVKDEVHGIVVSEEGIASYARAMQRMITDIQFRKLCGERGRNAASLLAECKTDDYARAWVTALEC